MDVYGEDYGEIIIMIILYYTDITLGFEHDIEVIKKNVQDGYEQNIDEASVGRFIEYC